MNGQSAVEIAWYLSIFKNLNKLVIRSLHSDDSKERKLNVPEHSKLKELKLEYFNPIHSS